MLPISRPAEEVEGLRVPAESALRQQQVRHMDVERHPVGQLLANGTKNKPTFLPRKPRT